MPGPAHTPPPALSRPPALACSVLLPCCSDVALDPLADLERGARELASMKGGPSCIFLEAMVFGWVRGWLVCVCAVCVDLFEVE